MEFREIAHINDRIVPVRIKHDSANIKHEFVFVEGQRCMWMCQVLLDGLSEIHMSSKRMFSAMLVHVIEWIHEDFGL